MRTTKIFWLFGLTLPFILFSATPGSTGAEPKRETRAPVITHAFAVEKGYYGDVWKIYIEAEDPDGQMLRIASVVDEVGYGHYPPIGSILNRNTKSILRAIFNGIPSARKHGTCRSGHELA